MSKHSLPEDRNLLQDFDSPQILVLGDFMIDENTYLTAPPRPAREDASAPVLTLPLPCDREQTTELGGAGRVARYLKELTACPAVVCPTNADLRSLLRKVGIETLSPLTPDHSFSTKHRIYHQDPQGGPPKLICRVDTESPQRVYINSADYWRRHQNSDEDCQHPLCWPTTYSGFYIADYAKGAVCPEMLASLEIYRRCRSRPGFKIFADVKAPNLGLYHDFPWDVMKISLDDLEIWAKMGTLDLNDIDSAARNLLQELTSDNQRSRLSLKGAAPRTLLVTCGAAGVISFTDTPSEAPLLVIDASSHVAKVYNQDLVRSTIGAGDALLSCIAFGMLSSARMNINEAIHFGSSIVGRLLTGESETCGLTYPHIGDLHHNITLSSGAFALARAPVTHVVGFTNGCFDGLHKGHLKLLEGAKYESDTLVVGVNTDESVRRLKGPSRPQHPLVKRLLDLARCEHVDYVMPFSEDTPTRLIDSVRPQLVFKGDEYIKSAVVKGSDPAVTVKLIGMLPGYSTTELLDKGKAT